MRAFALIILILLSGREASAEIGLHLGSHIGYGGVGSEASDAYGSRAVGSFGIQAMPGYRMGSLLLGPLLDLRFIGQFGESPGTLDGSPKIDYGGRSFTIGLGASYLIPGIVKALAAYDIFARYSHSPDSTLKGSGLRVLLALPFPGGSAVGLQYSSTSYNARSRGGEEHGLGPDNNVHHWDIAIGLSWEIL